MTENELFERFENIIDSTLIKYRVVGHWQITCDIINAIDGKDYGKTEIVRDVLLKYYVEKSDVDCIIDDIVQHLFEIQIEQHEQNEKAEITESATELKEAQKHTVEANKSAIEAESKQEKEAETLTELNETKKANESTNESTELKADYNQLIQYINNNIVLYAQCTNTINNAPYFVDYRNQCRHYPKSVKLDSGLCAIKTADDLQTALDNGVIRFSWIPSNHWYICLDIDRNHANGIDGLKELEAFCSQKNLDYQSLIRGVYVRTVNGGYHLYFTGFAVDGVRFRSVLCDNVEIRAGMGKQGLTAGGSVRNGKLYELHGNIKDAPECPCSLLSHLMTEQKKKSPVQVKKYSYNAQKEPYSLERLVEFVLTDHKNSGRNDTAYYIGYRVGKQYDIDSVVNYCKGLAFFAGFPESELRTAIQSGMNNSKY